MPRSKVGVQQMRVQRGDHVYILAHRIPFVVWREHRWSERKRVQLLDRLQREESEGRSYTVTTRFDTPLTGLVYVHDDAGHRYSAHHTDLVRM